MYVSQSTIIGWRSAHRIAAPGMSSARLDRAGGVLPQASSGPQQPPEAVKKNGKLANALDYRACAVADGIPHRAHGLFPPRDQLLEELAGTPGLQPFEKHLAGELAPSEPLPKGGWATGDAAAQHGMDLRLFYQDPAPGEQYGKLKAALRYGDNACIGMWTSVHGGAIETALDEATAELAKISWTPNVSTVDISFKIRKAVLPHTTLLVECKVREQKGIRLVVEGTIQPAQGGTPLATCEATLVDMSHFM